MYIYNGGRGKRYLTQSREVMRDGKGPAAALRITNETETVAAAAAPRGGFALYTCLCMCVYVCYSVIVLYTAKERRARCIPIP